MILATREQIAEDLWSYGEDGLAERLKSKDRASGEQVALICGVAQKFVYDERYALPSGSSMMISKALALAAVEVLEGKERELKRKRRRRAASSRG